MTGLVVMGATAVVSGWWIWAARTGRIVRVSAGSALNLEDITSVLDVVEIIANDHVPCRVGAMIGCTADARWAFRCPSCGMDWTACDPHRTRLDSPSYAVLGLVCDGVDGCGHRIPKPLPWRPI